MTRMPHTVQQPKLRRASPHTRWAWMSAWAWACAVCMAGSSVNVPRVHVHANSTVANVPRPAAPRAFDDRQSQILDYYKDIDPLAPRLDLQVPLTLPAHHECTHAAADVLHALVALVPPCTAYKTLPCVLRRRPPNCRARAVAPFDFRAHVDLVRPSLAGVPASVHARVRAKLPGATAG